MVEFFRKEESFFDGKRCILCGCELTDIVFHCKNARKQHPNSNRCRQHQPQIQNMRINPMFESFINKRGISNGRVIYHKEQDIAYVKSTGSSYIKIPTHMIVEQENQYNTYKFIEIINHYQEQNSLQYTTYFDRINLKIHIIIYDPRWSSHAPSRLFGFTVCLEQYTATTPAVILLSLNDYVNNTREPLNFRGNFNGENEVIFDYSLKKVAPMHPGNIYLEGIASIIPDVQLTIEKRNSPLVLSMLDGSEFEVRDYWLYFDWLELLFEQNPPPTDGSDDILKDIRDDKDELYCVVFTDDEPCGTEVTEHNFHIYCPLALDRPDGVTFMMLYRQPDD